MGYISFLLESGMDCGRSGAVSVLGLAFEKNGRFHLGTLNCHVRSLTILLKASHAGALRQRAGRRAQLNPFVQLPHQGAVYVSVAALSPPDKPAAR